MALYRSDQARIQVSVPGIAMDDVSWDKLDGGENVAPGENYLPGGMQPAIELGSVPKRTNVTVSRIWSDTLINVWRALDNGAGSLHGSVVYTVLDANRNVVPGSTLTYSGVLLEVHRPGYDAAAPAAAQFQLIFGVNGSVI